MKDKIIPNAQITKVKARDFEKPAHSDKFDSTLDERERTYQARKPEPRFSEYR